MGLDETTPCSRLITSFPAQRAGRTIPTIFKSSAHAVTEGRATEMTLTSAEDLLRTLSEGSFHRFSDWPPASLPNAAAGVYSIWDERQLVYVGMSGRGATAEQVMERKFADRNGASSRASRATVRGDEAATSSASTSATGWCSPL